MKITVGTLLPGVAMLLASVATVAALRLGKTEVASEAPTYAPPEVEVLEVAPEAMTPRLQATGVVSAADRVVLTAEVSGKVAWVAACFVPGGECRRGDILVRLDDREYRLVVEQEEVRVRQAALELQLEEGRVEVAAREWELLDLPAGPGASALALRTPQLEVARAGLASAQAGLARARLNLERTRVRVPFDAVVVERKATLGQLVGPAAPVATLIGSERLWVTVSVPVAQVALIEVPGLGATNGSEVTIVQRLDAEHVIERRGRVLRLEGELDRQVRTAQLLIEVDSPRGAHGELPLLAGAYVEVEIAGPALEGTVRLPRSALVGGEALWTVDEGGKLKRRVVRPAWTSREHVFVRGGLAPGEQVVVSALATPVAGMQVVSRGAAQAGYRGGER